MIFDQENKTSWLYHLDKMLAFAPNKEEAIKRLRMVFSWLRKRGLKLARKKGSLLPEERRVPGAQHWQEVATDPEKVQTITHCQWSRPNDGEWSHAFSKEGQVHPWYDDILPEVHTKLFQHGKALVLPDSRCSRQDQHKTSQTLQETQPWWLDWRAEQLLTIS